MATFVLVHGAFMGGWAWRKVAPLLEHAGHTTIAPDLPGHGADRTPAREVTLQTYADRVGDVLRAQTEPAVLAGHSMGGVVISQAAEQCPDSVRLLVYVTAYLLPSGQSLLDARDPANASIPYQHRDEADGTLIMAPEGIGPAYMQDCSPEDVAFAQAACVPQPLAPLSTPVRITEAGCGRIPRVYIECRQDRAITAARQQQMYTAMPCAKVRTLDTSHMPLFSAPEALALALLSLV